MDISLLHKFFWIVSLTFDNLPLINPGLLSDYKICGDSECESLMSRVQAIRDHKSNDCRFLSFRRGDIIFVYHKLTGKREDLWAGSIDKQFGYFPKDAVQEEQVFATMETAVETQKSDFFCIDKFGYPFDSDDDNNQETPKQESNINVITEYLHETNPKGSLTSEDISAESLVSAQQIDGPKTLGDEADPPEEVHEIHAASNKQGGSASSSWLSSSVTGWFGVEQQDEPPKGESEDEKTENKDETSLTSSVTGWLGFERNSEQDNADEIVTIPDKTTDTIALTVTGWLSFGGKEKSDDEKKKHGEEETDEGIEPAEKYRSRQMYLDLEGSNINEEEKTEMGTLGWLGSKLSSRMGFGLTNQNADKEIKEKEKQEYNFWPNTGIGDILGFGKENEDVDIKGEKEQGNALGEPKELHNVHTSVLEAPPMDEAKIVTSKLQKEKGILKDPYPQSPEDVKVDSTDTDNYKVVNEDALDRNENNLQRNEDELQVDELSEKFQMNAEMSSMKSSISLRENKEKNDSEEIKIKERSEEMDKGNEIFKSAKNWEQDTTDDPADEEVTTTDNNLDFIKPTDGQSWSEGSYNELLPNSLGRSEGKDAPQTEKKEFVKVTTQEYSPSESTDVESKSSDDRKVDGKDFNQKEEALEENQVSGETEAAAELIQENVSFTPDDKLNLTAVYSDTSDTGSHQDKSQIEEEAKSVWTTSKESGSSISAQEDESLSEYPSKENVGNMPSSDRTSTVYKEPAVHSINIEEITNLHEHVEEETLGFKEDVLSQSALKSTPRPETETKKIEMLRGQIETNEKGNDSQKEEKQQEVNDKEKVDEMKDKQQTDMEGEKKEDDVELKKKVEATMEEEKDISASKDEEEAELQEKEGNQVNKVKPKVEQQANNEKQTLLKEEQQVIMEDTMESEEANENEMEEEKKNLRNVEMERMYRDRSTKALDSNQKEGTGDSLSSIAGTVKESENQEFENEKEKKEETPDVKEVIDERMEVNEVDDKQQMMPVEAESLEHPNFPKEQESAVTEHHEEEGRSADEMVGVEEQEDRGDDTGERQVIVSKGNDSEMQGVKTEGSTSGSEVHSDGREPSEALLDKVDSQTSHVSEEHKRGLSTREAADSETKETFGLFRKAFSFFSQTPTTESTESVQLANTFNNSSGETQELQMQEPPPTTDSPQPQQVNTPSLTEQPYPPSAEINILHGVALTTDALLERKTLTGQYKNLHHIDVDEMTVLMELFGPHRLKILDDVLTSPEAETEKVDQSILSEIESLIQYHKEILVSSTVRTADATQEDKEETRTLVALEKTEMLLKNVKKTSDSNNHKAENVCDSTSFSAEDIDKKANIQDASATQDDNICREEQMVEEKANGFMDSHMIKVRKSVDEETGEKGRKEERQSPPHSQPQREVMRQILDPIHHVRGIIVWLTVQD